ncbi:GTP-binding protein At2g22870-like [Asparagus officinalis]|uniref:GTP-binding protein At2g22870-like n=1 Tax=Asparagus officinalis TaxID=4686 RepID=UPI00098E14A7|nr:GTP-binding protein At2g22870-like [Asparagus officinalis]
MTRTPENTLISHPENLPLNPNVIRRRKWREPTPTSPIQSREPTSSDVALFVPSGFARADVTTDMVLPSSNIVIGPYAGDAKIKQVEFIKLHRPRISLEFALTSKKPGNTQLINHFLVNKSWYIVDLLEYRYQNG